MPVLYTAKLHGVEVYATNSNGCKYPILRTNIRESGSSGSLMTIHLGVPRVNVARPRIFEITWTCSATQLPETYYCAFKAANVIATRGSHAPAEVYRWIGAYTDVCSSGVHSSADRKLPPPRYINGWPMLAQKPAGYELATVTFEIQKVRNPSVIPAKLLDRKHRNPLSVSQMRDFGVEVDLERPFVTFHFIFESVNNGNGVYDLLPKGSRIKTAPLATRSKGSKRKRDRSEMSRIIHLGTIDLVDSDDDEDSDMVSKPGASQKKRTKPSVDGRNSSIIQPSYFGGDTKGSHTLKGEESQQPPRLIRTSASLISQDREPEKLMQAPVDLSDSWKRLGALAEEKGELMARVRELIKKDEARVKALREFIEKYEN